MAHLRVIRVDLMDIVGFASAEIALSLPPRWRCHRRWVSILNAGEKMLYQTANWCNRHGSGRAGDRLMTRYPRLWHHLVYPIITRRG